MRNFSKKRLKFKMSVHFVKDRMNHPRNTPAAFFNRLTTIYLSQLMRLRHNDSFNIRCTKSDINIPCAISKTKDATGKDNREVIAIKVAQPTRDNMKSDVAAYIKYYNLDRLHTANGDVSPINFENAQKKVSGFA